MVVGGIGFLAALFHLGGCLPNLSLHPVSVHGCLLDHGLGLLFTLAPHGLELLFGDLAGLREGVVHLVLERLGLLLLRRSFLLLLSKLLLEGVDVGLSFGTDLFGLLLTAGAGSREDVLRLGGRLF